MRNDSQIIKGSYVEAALILMGAQILREVYDLSPEDPNRQVIGYEVSPPLDMSGYAAAVKQIKQNEVEASRAILRSERDQRLSASDWTQMPDAPLDDKLRAAWAKYRQALRDLPASVKDPMNPVWPEVPAR